jgi:hypothetical protein
MKKEIKKLNSEFKENSEYRLDYKFSQCCGWLNIIHDYTKKTNYFCIIDKKNFEIIISDFKVFHFRIFWEKLQFWFTENWIVYLENWEIKFKEIQIKKEIIENNIWYSCDNISNIDEIIEKIKDKEKKEEDKKLKEEEDKKFKIENYLEKEIIFWNYNNYNEIEENVKELEKIWWVVFEKWSNSRSWGDEFWYKIVLLNKKRILQTKKIKTKNPASIIWKWWSRIKEIGQFLWVNFIKVEELN